MLAVAVAELRSGFGWRSARRVWAYTGVKDSNCTYLLRHDPRNVTTVISLPLSVKVLEGVGLLRLLGEAEVAVIFVDGGAHGEVLAGTPASAEHKTGSKLGATSGANGIAWLLLLLRGEGLETWRSEILRQGAPRVRLIRILRNLAFLHNRPALAILHILHHGPEVGRIAHRVPEGRRLGPERRSLAMTRGLLCHAGAGEGRCTGLEDGRVRGEVGGRRKGRGLHRHLLLDGGRGGRRLEVCDHALQRRQRVTAFARRDLRRGGA